MGQVFHVNFDKIGVQTSEDGLVCYDNHRFPLAFEFEDNRLYAFDQVHVAFPSGVAVVELVEVSGVRLLCACFLNLSIRHTVEDPNINLIEALEPEGRGV
jgi:hypothetical protein